MARRSGQVDVAKTEAMMVAATEVISERGFGAPVEAIAKRAGVSKQTLYNHFGGKAGLLRALISRRVEVLTAPLDGAPDTEAALTGFALELVQAMLSPANIALTRVAIQGAADMPEIAQAMHETGALAALARLASFLKVETDAGRLDVDDPNGAAELFAGMVGVRQIRALMGLPVDVDAATLERFSATIAHRFIAAYAPKAAA